MIIALIEGLVSEDPKTLKPVPGVAEKWEVSEDGLVYTFHLRKNAKWSNGDPVTAQDFVFSYKRILNPELAKISICYRVLGCDFKLLTGLRFLWLAKMPENIMKKGSHFTEISGEREL